MKDKELNEILLENRRFRMALETIKEWRDFPEYRDSNGKVWNYSVGYGSNGERDFMRTIAAEALDPNFKVNGRLPRP